MKSTRLYLYNNKSSSFQRRRANRIGSEKRHETTLPTPSRLHPHLRAFDMLDGRGTDISMALCRYES